MIQATSWEDFCAWLDQLGMFHMELNLGRIKSALAKTLPPELPFTVVQVLGTNGKGSTSTFLSSLTTSHGLRCGLFLSPHFVSIEERIKIDGQPIEREAWLECVAKLRDVTANGPQLTYFEFLTVLALMLFVRCKVDVAILEAGLGGKNDATSAIPAQFHCFTPIAMDHAHIIGPGLEDIALDKLAAIKSNAMVYSAPQTPKIMELMKSACAQKDASLKFIEALPALPDPGMKGDMQKLNASLALATWRALSKSQNIESRPDVEARAIRRAFIPGRFQLVQASVNLPCLILDGAHNPHAMQELVRNLARHKPSAIIFSALKDKDWPVCVDLLNRLPAMPMFIPELDNPRAARPEDIAARRNRAHPDTARCFHGKNALEAALSGASAIPRHPRASVLLTGSLYLLADFYKLHPQYLDAP